MRLFMRLVKRRDMREGIHDVMNYGMNNLDWDHRRGCAHKCACARLIDVSTSVGWQTDGSSKAQVITYDRTYASLLLCDANDSRF